MIFSSVVFIFFFLPAVIFGAHLFNKYAPETPRIIYWLGISSFFFYAYWKLSYLPILLLSIVINWLLGEKIRSSRAKTWLTIGVFFNLSLIGYYKYADFFVGNLNAFLGSDFSHLDILLPLGISFFTFQQIAYLVDTYKDKTEKTDFLKYTFFVSFFPQLIAGPIVHHRHILPYIQKPGTLKVTATTLLDGSFIFSIGLFKKVLIADSLAVYATPFFNAVDSGTTLNNLSALMGLLAYTFQIYFDFSGYSDMAIGLGLMFGIYLPLNFYSPYKAGSIIEFWRRWHMTLSEFLRDYLYIPLGGNRKGKIRRYANLVLTMLLGGLWHGASWNFVLWGGMHGLYLMINHFWQSLKLPQFRWLTPIYIVVTFVAASLVWVPFRATTWDGTVLFYKSLFSFSDAPNLEGIHMSAGWCYILGAALVTFCLPNTWQILKRYDDCTTEKKSLFRFFGFVLFIAASITVTFIANRTSEFIYFNF